MQVQIKRFTGVLYNNLTTMPHIWFDALRCKIKGISSKSIGIIYNILIKLYGIKKRLKINTEKFGGFKYFTYLCT